MTVVYSFCESVFAGPLSPWHIRVLSGVGPKYGGGIDTPSLCKRVKPTRLAGATAQVLNNEGHGGWDLRVDITEHHIVHACVACRDEYRRRIRDGSDE